MYKGEKVRLREYRREDLETKLRYINDPEVERLLVSEVPYPETLAEEEKWFESISAYKDTYRFAIEALDGGKYIGECGVCGVDWKNSSAGISIFIGDRGYWGKGYGSDAVKILISFIFNEMNMNKIRLNVYSFNERAMRCYKKCGFKVEGVLREEIYRGGKYYDTIAMGLLRREYLDASTDQIGDGAPESSS